MHKIEAFISKDSYKKDESVLMSVYDFLFNTVSEIYSIADVKKFSFDRIKEELLHINTYSEEDSKEYLVKLEKAEKKYLAQFVKTRDELNVEIRALKRENKELSANLEQIKKEKTKLQDRLDRINNRTIVKLYRKIKKLF